MNKFYKSAMFVACLFVTTLTTSCVTQNTASIVPDEQFIFIKQDYVANVCNLLTGECKRGLAKESGSGVIIGHDLAKNKSYILTAAHVCIAGPVPDQIPPYIKYDIPLSNLVVYDSKNRSHNAKIFAFDRTTDLCLVESERIDRHAITLAKKAPENRDRVTNVAAPYGMWKDGTGVLYEGSFFHILGRDAYYTLTVMPGSSGSPIVNKSGKLVGIISRGTDNGEVAISPTYGQIRTFLEENPF